MTQRLVWPVDLQRQEDGAILVSFPGHSGGTDRGGDRNRRAHRSSGLPYRRDWRLCRGATPDPQPVSGARTGVGGAAGTNGRQSRAIRRNARTGNRQHSARCPARPLGRRGPAPDKPRSPFAHRPNRSGSPCSRTAVDGRHASGVGQPLLPCGNPPGRMDKLARLGPAYSAMASL